MPSALGPILRLRCSNPNDGVWKVSVLVCAQSGDPAPALWAIVEDDKKRLTPSTRFAILDVSAHRFDLDIPLLDKEQDVHYGVEGEDEEWRFCVPPRTGQPRFAYASCNGFSSLKLMKSVKDKNALWTDMDSRHNASPYHVLLMGGDQVYADSMWEMVEPLHAWNQLSWHDPKKNELPANLEASLSRHFLCDMYLQRWNQPEVRKMLASIPTIMMWDDHDIMDGWGSYEDKWQDSPVYRTIFEVARRCFEIFQLQGTHPTSSEPGDPVYIRDVAAGYSQLWQFGTIAILVPDLRSERRQGQVLSAKSWGAIYAALDDLNSRHGERRCRHLVVMSSIPVMHARFCQIESMLGWAPGQQELEDDLRDHWSSRQHRAERLRLIHRLLAFSKQKRVRVTFVSGDVHVAAHGNITSTRQSSVGNEGALVQLTSSGIVHPAPPAIMRFALNHLFAEEEEIDRNITGRMEKMPGDERRYVAARNWLSIEPDDATKDNRNSDNPRLWAHWHVEEGSSIGSFTRVIHPVSEQ